MVVVTTFHTKLQSNTIQDVQVDLSAAFTIETFCVRGGFSIVHFLTAQTFSTYMIAILNIKKQNNKLLYIKKLYS